MIGLLGHNITYTFSPEIHNKLGYDYKVIDLNEEDFKVFMEHRNFSGLNVTIPYKDKVIEYLDVVSPLAKSLNAVNTIVNKDGKLYGYNTDYYGLKHSLSSHEVDVEDKKVLVLGTGNTAHTVQSLLKSLNAKEVICMGRETKINYDNLDDVLDFHIIVNTTPVGVYPNIYNAVLSLERFYNLETVVDVIYNPLNSKLVSDAKALGLKAFGGLHMLVAQAVYSSEYFFDKTYSKETINNILSELYKEKQNIVLIGMPTAGKTTISKLLSEAIERKVFDVDELIVLEEERSIPVIFEASGEAYFRSVESSIIKTLSKEKGIVIATGGGSILDPSNVEALKMSGKLVFIDRPLELLISEDSRPLTSNHDKLTQIYNERIDLYRDVADIIIKNDGSIDDALNALLEVIK